MFEHLRALVKVATDGEPAVMRRLGMAAFLSVATDFLLMVSLLMGLAKQRLGEPVDREGLLFLVGLGGFCFFTLSVGRELNLRYTNAARLSINSIATRLPRLPLLEFEALDRGTLMTRILGDGNQVATCRQAVFSVISGILRLFLGGVFALSLSLESSALAFAGLLLIGVVAASQMLVLREGFARVAGDDARMYELLHSQLLGAVALRLHRLRGEALQRSFDAISERVRVLRTTMFQAFYDRQFAGDALVYGLLGLNVFVMPLVASIDSEAIREMNMVTLWLVVAAVKLVMGLPRISSAGSALARLQELEAKLTDEHLEPTVSPDDLAGGPFVGFARVEVENLQFEYPSSTKRAAFPLGPISLTFQRGELVFITGHNGSGKSTFVRLLAGLYRPSAGQIVVDGTSVSETNLAAWRTQIATIFTEHYLFDRTHGLDAEAERRMPALLEQLGIAGKTSILGGRVSNRALSTGQKKRLAMALARTSNKPILILDEWAADQDPEFRKLFYDELLPTLRDEGRLVIVISHDDEYFDRADRCLRFDRGKLVEETT